MIVCSVRKNDCHSERSEEPAHFAFAPAVVLAFVFIRSRQESSSRPEAAHLAAAGLGVTLLPDNVVPADLAAAVRRLRSPIVRKLAAFTRHEPSPLASAFLDVLGEHEWQPKPRNATVIA